MKQFFYLSVFCVLALTACTGAFKKGEIGLEYKIISGGGKQALVYGNFIQMHVKQVYSGTKDTVLMDSRDLMPSLQIFDSVNTPLPYYNILRQLKKGDSLIIRMLTDSAIKGSPQGMPPFMQKGKYIYTYVKLINVFETQAQVDSAMKAELLVAKPRMYKKQLEEIEKQLAKNKEQIEKDQKIIADYLLKNNIKAQKTKWGTYVAITTEGTGNLINNEDVATVNYTGKTLDSAKVFDSNIDPKFQHVQPLQVIMNQMGSVILGWTDALLQLKKGSKATVYVPSSLGYGKTGNGSDIKPDANLIFDMEIINVENESTLKEKQEEAQKKMTEAAKMRNDSLQKANK